MKVDKKKIGERSGERQNSVAGILCREIIRLRHHLNGTIEEFYLSEWL